MKMSGHSLYIFIIISSICILMLWFLTPIYCALFFAFTATPLVQYMIRHPWKSLISFLVVFLGGWFTLPFIKNELQAAGISIVSTVQKLSEQFPDIAKPFHSNEWDFEALQSFFAADTLYATLQLSSGWVMEAALFCSLFFIALVTFVRKPASWISLLPTNKQQAVQQLLTSAQSISYTFFRNEVLLISITWLLSWLFLFTIHFPHAFVVGLLIAVLDVIPFLGVSLFYLPLAFYLLAENQEFHGAMTLLFFFFLVFSRHLIEPLLWKQRVSLPTLAVLVILSSALMLFGVKGFLLIPLCFVTVAQFQVLSKH